MEEILDLEDSQFERIFTDPVPQPKAPEPDPVTIEGKDPAPVEDLFAAQLVRRTEDIQDLEDFEDLEETEVPEEKEPAQPEKKEKAKPEQKPKKETPAPAAPPVEEEEEQTEEEYLSQILGSSAEYMIKSGIWNDWDGREDEEWTNERWAEILEEQAEAKVEQRYEAIKQSNEVLTTIFDYIEEGGDPAKAIDLFNRHKSVEDSFDLSTDDGKKGYILDYYTKIVGEKRARAQRILEEEVNGEGLDNFFNEIKTKYDAHFTKEKEEMFEEQRRTQQQLEQRKKQIQQGVVNELRTLNMDSKAGNEIANYALTPVYNYQGKEITALEWDYIKAQRDPKTLVKLSQFLKDPDKYDESVSLKRKNDEVERSFSFVKNTKPKSTETRKEQASGKKVSTKPLQFNIN